MSKGGKREGAGKPPLYSEPTKVRQVTLRDSDWELFKELGEGSAAAGIRALADKHRLSGA